MHVLEPAGGMLAELLDSKTTPVAVTTRCRARIEVQDFEVMVICHSRERVPYRFPLPPKRPQSPIKCSVNWRLCGRVRCSNR